MSSDQTNAPNGTLPSDVAAVAPSADGVAAVSEADPNTDTGAAAASSDKPATDGDIDVLAADTAEGEVSGATVIAPDSGATPVSSKKSKDSKRRSSGVPEHKSKKGKKREIVLNLDCKPGDYFFARMKGHPEWPSIIADEDMLPDQILGARPVTARRADYTYRDDFADGGKNVKDRTYPVMFLGTNEFAWMVNSDLRKITPENVKDFEKAKAKKALTEAYEIANKFHGLEYFKKILLNFETARAQEEQAYAEKMAAQEAKRAEKSDKPAKEGKAKRKSTAADGEDVTMTEDGEAPKSSKKRKKSLGDDAEEKPAKTPKIKLSQAKANGDSAKKAKTPKVKTPKEIPQLTEEELKDKKEKSVLYLRHKLQKGFLASEIPKETELAGLAAHFEALQQYKVLEPGIIRTTKIHKVLKAILKLDNVPQDDKYNFKKQSNDLLQGWNKILAEEATDGAVTTNGTKDDKAEPETKAEPAALVEAAVDAKDEAQDGDVSMADASAPAKPEAESARADAVPSATDAAAPVPATAEVNSA